MDKYWLVVADDDYLCLKNIKALLDADNLCLSCVRSGEELLRFLKKNSPDLILLDVVMPGMDGFETYRRLREAEEKEGRRQIPVIFLTGGEDSENEQRGLSLGAADFIYKPVNRDVLLSRINKIISNSRTINDLEEEAVTDHLTGFYNKAGTEERMAELCRHGGGMLMILDLDNFKLVNDLYGHDMGDQVLKAFADIARQCSRQDDVLCRIGGDEFLVFFRNTRSERAVAAFSERLNERILNECKKLMGENFSLPVGVSLGCVLVPEKGGAYREFFQLADRALYQVKQNGKHGYRFCDSETQSPRATITDPDQEFKRMLTLCEERSEARQAMWVGQETFTWIYRFMERFAARYHDPYTRMMFMLRDEGRESVEDYAEASFQFGCIIQSILRKNDVITQNRPDCFFLLLPELCEENVPVIMDRVRNAWEKTPYHKGIEIVCRMDYSVGDVTEGENGKK